MGRKCKYLPFLRSLDVLLHCITRARARFLRSVGSRAPFYYPLAPSWRLYSPDTSPREERSDGESSSCRVSIEFHCEPPPPRPSGHVLRASWPGRAVLAGWRSISSAQQATPPKARGDYLSTVQPFTTSRLLDTRTSPTRRAISRGRLPWNGASVTPRLPTHPHPNIHGPFPARLTMACAPLSRAGSASSHTPGHCQPGSSQRSVPCETSEAYM